MNESSKIRIVFLSRGEFKFGGPSFASKYKEKSGKTEKFNLT